jgi:hypothetical protein
MKINYLYLSIIICILFVFGCVTRSNMEIYKASPMCCKLFLECMYYMAENKADKSGCMPFMDCCKKSVIYDKCRAENNETENTREFQTCLDKHL